MGWASGAAMYYTVIRVLQHRVSDDKERELLHRDLITVFEDEDWDTQDECLGIDPAFDNALYTLHPEWRDDD